MRNLGTSDLLFIEQKPIQKLILVNDAEQQQQKHLWAATWDSSINRWPIPLDFHGFDNTTPKVRQPDMTIGGLFFLFFWVIKLITKAILSIFWSGRGDCCGFVSIS